jgi:hypothetical protein
VFRVVSLALEDIISHIFTGLRVLLTCGLSRCPGSDVRSYEGAEQDQDAAVSLAVSRPIAVIYASAAIMFFDRRDY